MPCLLCSTENLPTQTNTCIWRAITTNLLIIVCLILSHRARTVCFNTQLLHKEAEHIRGAFLGCKYPTWPSIEDQKQQQMQQHKQAKNSFSNRNINTNNNNHNNIHVVVPYTNGHSKNFKTLVIKEGKQAFTMTNRLAFSGLWKNFIVTKSRSTYRGTTSSEAS